MQEPQAERCEVTGAHPLGHQTSRAGSPHTAQHGTSHQPGAMAVELGRQCRPGHVPRPDAAPLPHLPVY